MGGSEVTRVNAVHVIADADEIRVAAVSFAQMAALQNRTPGTGDCDASSGLRERSLRTANEVYENGEWAPGGK